MEKTGDRQADGHYFVHSASMLDSGPSALARTMFEIDGDTFRMLTPLPTLSKGVGRQRSDDDEEEGEADNVPGGLQRLIDGPASTPARDMQGEIVEPMGFDLSYFKLHGRINWDHGKAARDIIGQPVRWKLTRKGLWLQAVLYNGVDQADDAWKIFQADATLAWSVEGKVTERDKKDPTRIVRAYVINVALTPNPVGQETWARQSKPMAGAGEHVLSKTLTTTSGGVLMRQSLEGADVPPGPWDEVFNRHIAKTLGMGVPTCGCVSRSDDAGRFVNGYRGALAHFFDCCGASPETASELAGRHDRIAQVTGVLMKGDL